MPRRHRTSPALTVAGLLVLGSALSAGSALAVGTCKGHAIEYPLPSEVHDATLSAYDLNGDGVICVATKGHRTAYSDNRP